MKKYNTLIGLCMIVMLSMVSITVQAQYTLSPEDIVIPEGVHTISCTHDHLHKHDDHVTRDPLPIHVPSDCAVALNAILVEGPNRGRDGARFPRQYEQLFKNNFNVYFTDMPTAVSDPDIEVEDMPYLDSLFYIDYLQGIFPGLSDESLLFGANPDPDVTENEFNKIIRDEMALRASQGHPVDILMLYDEFVAEAIATALGFCEEYENVLIFIIKTTIPDPDNMTEDQVENLSFLCGHEVGHTIENNHEESSNGGGIVGQSNPCSEDNFAIFDQDEQATTIMVSTNDAENIERGKEQFGSYWSPTNGETGLETVALRDWYPDLNNCGVSPDDDGDGVTIADGDCDDSDPDVNPNVSEIPYNGVDDDCNPSTLDDDLDEDGFVLADDCDDLDATINPDADEIPYTGTDDDCDPSTLDDDLDQDGFVLADDCDDEDASINPDAEDIPNNGIDEDCDGQDSVSATIDLALLRLITRTGPNPVMDIWTIEFSETPQDVSLMVFDMQGRRLMYIQQVSQVQSIDVQYWSSGAYIYKLTSPKGVVSNRFVK